MKSKRGALATVIFTDAVQELVSKANQLRSAIQKRIQQDFSSYLEEDLHIGVFSLHKAKIVNTAHVIKELDVLCAKPIQSLSDVCRFTVRLQSLIDKANPSSVFSLEKKVATWLFSDCNQALNPIAMRQNELIEKEDDIHRRKVEILYHTLGREIELATYNLDVGMRAVKHEMAISAAILPTEGEYRDTLPENPATMYSVTSYSKELTRKIDELKTQVSRLKIEENWSPKQESDELKKQLKRLLRFEAHDLTKMRIHADVSRDIHTKRIQALSPEKKTMHFLAKALLEELADYLKYCEKLFLWEKLCVLRARRDRDRRQGNSYSPPVEFSLELLSAMYNEEKLLKNLSYPRKTRDAASPTDTPTLPSKQTFDPEDAELVSIPELAEYLKTDGRKSKLAAALSYQQKKKTTKTPLVDEQDKYFVGDILGVNEQAAKLKSYAGHILGDDLFEEIEICLNLSIDENVFIPTIHDDDTLLNMKKQVITNLVNEWRARVRKLVHEYCDEENHDSVFVRIKEYVSALERDPKFQPTFVNSEEKFHYQPYFDLVRFVKHEIDRADHKSLLLQYPQLMEMLNKLKQAVKPIVNIVKNKIAKQNISALETAAFFMGGVTLGLLVLVALIVGNIYVPVSVPVLAGLAGASALLGGSVGFAIKKIKNYFYHVRDENVVSQQLDDIKKIGAKSEVGSKVPLKKISPSVNAKLHQTFNHDSPSMQLALHKTPLPSLAFEAREEEEATKEHGKLRPTKEAPPQKAIEVELTMTQHRPRSLNH